MKSFVVLAAGAPALLFLTSCGSSPAAPSGGALPLRPGTYVIDFYGADFISIGSGPTMAGCPGISAAGLRPVSTEVDVTFDSGVWRARPHSAAGGSFELSFSPGPLGSGAPGGGPGVTASATGTLISTRSVSPLDPVPDSRVLFGAVATLTGGLSIDGRVGSGLVSGNVAFGDSSGRSVSCNTGTVSWDMSVGS